MIEAAEKYRKIMSTAADETIPDPLPPLAEQKAIVVRVEELLTLLGEVKERAI